MSRKKISFKKKSEVFLAKGIACVRCGGDDFIEIDHIVPLAKGGDNSIENLQPLCINCNTKKRDKNTLILMCLMYFLKILMTF